VIEANENDNSLLRLLLQLFGVWLTIKYRNLKDPQANPDAFL